MLAGSLFRVPAGFPLKFGGFCWPAEKGQMGSSQGKIGLASKSQARVYFQPKLKKLSEKLARAPGPTAAFGFGWNERDRNHTPQRDTESGLGVGDQDVLGPCCETYWFPVGVSRQHCFDYSSPKVEFTGRGLWTLNIQDVNPQYVLWYWRDKSLVSSARRHPIYNVKGTFLTKDTALCKYQGYLAWG